MPKCPPLQFSLTYALTKRSHATAMIAVVIILASLTLVVATDNA